MPNMPNPMKIPCSKNPICPPALRTVFGLSGADISFKVFAIPRVSVSCRYLCKKSEFGCRVAYSACGADKSLTGYRSERSMNEKRGAAGPTVDISTIPVPIYFFGVCRSYQGVLAELGLQTKLASAQTDSSISQT